MQIASLRRSRRQVLFFRLHTHGRPTRLARGNADQAETAARELGNLSLMDALSLVLLYARTGSPKFEPAAVRWLSRLGVEGREVRLADVQLGGGAALGCGRDLLP
jgi:hypothetical protein